MAQASPAAQFDVVVIGSGSGGLGAAQSAANFGAKVAIIEKLPRTGGDCTWHGCVPSKALIRCSRALADAKDGERFGVQGVQPDKVSANWDAVKAHVESCQRHIYTQDDAPSVLEQKGISCYVNRTAKFVTKNEIELAVTDEAAENGQRLVPTRIFADRFILSTGAGPSLPPIQGLDKVPYVTYETVFTMKDLPQRLLVVGGGPIGAELAQAFARLGSQVTIVAKLLPREDADVRQVMTEVFQADGIKVVEGRATKVEMRVGDVIALEAGGQWLEADRLLVCAGRRVKGLEALCLEVPGVAWSEKGIQVDNYLRTTAKHVYAVGDCVGGLQFTHLAAYQGGLAAASATLPLSFKAPLPADCPRCTFTHPEVATVGLTEDEARAKFGARVQVKSRQLSHVDRAVCEGDTRGFIKIIHNKAGKVLGATVVSNVAGETASELGVMIAAGTNISVLANNMHSYPSFAFALQMMAADIYMGELKNSSQLGWLRRCCGRRLRGASKTE